MTLELINPEDLPTPPTYTHVVIASGSRLVFVAGQEPEDEHGNVIGPGDLAVQARQVFSNGHDLAVRLRAAFPLRRSMRTDHSD